ncbi:CLUMA_CG021663, isoform A [Clunio marinus]|uniref:CLUMA_CG021663, isoform A n=1 Tax=Clunio marinus TaxID=568069 RepID=A0A1J1J995_9DIPT|nr:CLUMA_CG021663, isoform A [Clunio marinus]
MAESTKGRQVPTYDRFFFLFRIFYNFIAWLPKSWKLYLVRRYCEREKLPLEFHEPSLEYTNPPVIDKIWFLALDEMDKVRELDEKLLKENVNRVKLYYAVVDDWVPLDAYDSLKTKIPNIDAQVCTEGYEHAFVLKNGVEVGKIVSGWLNIKRQETQ